MTTAAAPAAAVAGPPPSLLLLLVLLLLRASPICFWLAMLSLALATTVNLLLLLLLVSRRDVRGHVGIRDAHPPAVPCLRLCCPCCRSFQGLWCQPLCGRVEPSETHPANGGRGQGVSLCHHNAPRLSTLHHPVRLRAWQAGAEHASNC